MTLIEIAAISLGCLLASQPVQPCVTEQLLQINTEKVAGITTPVPTKTGESIDVVVSAQAVYVWDVDTGIPLYEKNADVARPVASLSKLLSALTVRSTLQPQTVVEIPIEARRAQLLGANIKLPIGQHATVQELLAASLIASANDAIVTLAVASHGSEEAFVRFANEYGKELGLNNTKLSNSTGLSGGEQYSTAHDVARLLQKAYADPVLTPFLSDDRDVLTTQEGASRAYLTTNKLAGTYLPILAAKTGYTTEAGENLAIITEGAQGQRIGTVILGSTDRFQDTKVVVEWIWRNFTWE